MFTPKCIIYSTAQKFGLTFVLVLKTAVEIEPVGIKCSSWAQILRKTCLLKALKVWSRLDYISTLGNPYSQGVKKAVQKLPKKLKHYSLYLIFRTVKGFVGLKTVSH